MECTGTDTSAQTGRSMRGSAGAEEGPRAEHEPRPYAGGETLVYETNPGPLVGSAGNVGDRVRRVYDTGRRHGRAERSASRPAPSAASAAPGASAAAGPSEELIAAAKAEGGLTTIALPRDWCNYGEVIDSFTAKYGIPINGLTPGGSSGDEIEAIKANQDNPGPQAPDVVDVGFSFGEDNKDLFTAVQGRDLGHDPRLGQGRRRRLVRRLLRRDVVHDQPGRPGQPAQGLGRPAEAGIQGPGRARRRPAHVEPGHPGGLRRRIGQRWLTRQRAAGSRLLQEGRRRRQLRPGRRQPGHHRPGRDARRIALVVQRPVAS